jgi:hypothetical protein
MVVSPPLAMLGPAILTKIRQASCVAQAESARSSRARTGQPTNFCFDRRSGHAAFAWRWPLLTDGVEKGLVIFGEQ